MAPDPSDGLSRIPVTQRRREIVADLAAQITSGLLAEGRLIPTVAQLDAVHGLSRWTALRVQQDLHEQRLVRLIPGTGYVVGRPDDEPRPVVPVQERIEQIAREWAEKIRTGEIGVHGMVPGVPRMRHMYGISKYAAQEVIYVLHKWGLIYTLQGKGNMAAPSHCWAGDDPPEEAHMSPMERHQAKMKRAEERRKRLAQVKEEQSAIMRERTARRKGLR